MRVRNRYLSILSSFILLTGCSFSPSIKKVDFSSYGKEVTYEDFVATYRTRYMDVHNQYFSNLSTSDLSTLKDNVCIESFRSSITTFDSNYDSKSNYQYYVQVEEEAYVDIINQRFKRASTSKYYNKQNGVNPRDLYENSFYGEVVDNIFYFVNVTDKLCFRYNSILFGNYASTFWSNPSPFDSLPPYNQGQENLYYINGNKFTYVTSNSYLQGILQYDFSHNEMTLKTEEAFIEESDRGTSKNTTYLYINIKHTNKQIKPYDYHKEQGFDSGQ